MKPKTFFSLVRIPTVFSSMSNAYAGYFIGGGRDFGPPLLLGILASALFIMAGMALNDVADKDVDARERPNRPIPSGAASLRAAWGASLAMLAAGLVLLWLANPRSAAVGAALVAAICAYNFFLKQTALGPPAMGFCRLLNLLTGISLTWDKWPDPSDMPAPMALALFSLWAYIALVTYLARDEVQGNSRLRARIFMALFAAWVIGWSLAIWFLVKPVPLAAAFVWLLLLAGVLKPLRNLARDPSPRHTGQAIGGLLRMVPVVDALAMLANQVPLVIALAGLLWVAPAYVVGKKFYST